MIADLDLETLFESLRSGNRRTGGLVMSLIEDCHPQKEEILKRLYECTNRALAIGVTGWPGVGKSSLIKGLAQAFLDKGHKVGIIPVDPTSPFSGGSLLGDRVRLREIEGRENLYIRSMASRGHPGGLANSARALVKIMETMGYDVVLMETVGAGQDQTNVALIVDTTIVVVAPGLGDRLQAIKSGILEVGDILVVNKGDRLGADGTAADLLNAVMMGERKGWHPPVIKTVALESKGIEELMAEIARHAAHSAAEGSAKARKHRAAENEIVEAIKTRLFERFFNGEDPIGKSMSEYAARLCERKSDPLILADAILREKDIS